jgi:YggT family protein
MVGVIVSFLISTCLLILTIRAMISFLPIFNRDWTPRGVMLVLVEVVYTLTDPPIRFFRKFIPPLRLGGMQIDLAFMVLWFALILLGRFLPALLS